ncbi:hypothetical protein JCM16303_006119 [Sporobolomyces ruberrimus]
MSTPAKRTVGGEITNTPGSSVPRAKRTKVSSGPSGGDLSTALTLGQDDSYSALYLELETEKQKKQPIVVTEEETWSDEKVATKVQQIKQMANKDIAKQLKWQPSCKTGTTKWSYTGMVPNDRVFFALFDLPVPRLKKEHWKVKKLPMKDFEDCIGRVRNSMRYGWLSVTGDTVTLQWNAEDKTFTFKGTYGL